MFYKNVFMSICQHFFAYLNGFSGQKIYPEAGIQMYNLLFTSLPIILLAVADMDIAPSTVYKNPELYMAGIKGEFFSTFGFWVYLMNGILEAVFVTFTSAAMLINSDPDAGVFSSFFACGALALTSVIFIVNIKIWFIQNQFHWVHLLAFTFSIGTWWAVVFAWESNMFIGFDYEWNQVWTKLNQNGNFWMGLLFIVSAIATKDLYMAAVERDVNPKAHHIMQEKEAIEKGLSCLDRVGRRTSERINEDVTPPNRERRLEQEFPSA